MKILELVIQDNLNPKKVSNTNGGEYHSPCPACGGKDRFIIWDIKNRYYCRRCEKTGDVIQYLKDFHGLSFKEACQKANITKLNFRTNTTKKTSIFNFTKQNFPNSKWQEKALDFVYNKHQTLLNTSEALSLLQKRDFTLDSIKEFTLGWNPQTIWVNWHANKKIWLPKGIVIPSFIDNKLYKIKIRRNDWSAKDKFPKYVEIHGSSVGPAIYGKHYDLPAIILESELDAMLIKQEAKDLCFSVALGGATKKPNSYTHSLLIKSPIILYSLDYDEAGIKAYTWWKKQYKNLDVWMPFIEKSIGDAFIAGVDIRDWISTGIKEFFKINKKDYL